MSYLVSKNAELQSISLLQKLITYKQVICLCLLVMPLIKVRCHMSVSLVYSNWYISRLFTFGIP